MAYSSSRTSSIGRILETTFGSWESNAKMSAERCDAWLVRSERVSDLFAINVRYDSTIQRNGIGCGPVVFRWLGSVSTQTASSSDDPA